MEALITFFEPFFHWLMETTLIASVVICLILAAQKTLGGRLGPRWCHALWLVLLVRMVLPWAPSSRFSLSNLIPSRDRQTQPQQSLGTVERQRSSAHAEGTEDLEAKPGKQPQDEATVREVAAPKPQTLIDVADKTDVKSASIRRFFPILWLPGAMLVGVYILVSDLALWRIVKRDRPLVNQEMLELFEECKAQMGIQSLVVVVPSNHIRSPGLFGFVRPRLLLPQDMLASATQEEMRYVFLHELAHLKRRDIYLGWVTSLLQILHWFNPLVWLAFYRMRADRELACDALVLTRTGQDTSHEYGGAILDLVRRFSRSRPLPAVAGIMENRSQLRRRIAMITRFKKNSYQWSPLAVTSIVILASISLPDARHTKASQTNPVMSVSAMTVRKLEYEWRGPFANLSPDGKYMSDRDWDTGTLVVRELATGKSRSSVDRDSHGPGSPMVSAISPDGKEVAYLWHDPSTKASSLHVIGLDGTGHRVLCKGKWPMPRDWSADGQKILATVLENNVAQMVWISASDGSIQHIVEVSLGYLGKVDISPDGRFIAYDHPQGKDPLKRDIFVFDLRENRELSVINHPADDRFLGWTPDGKHMFFISDRTGTWDAWLLPVAGGKPQGFPKLARHGIGNITPIGFTPQGSYYYGHEQTLEDVFVAKLDLETGEFLSEPMPVRQSGATGCHDWSPDGLYLAYCERHRDEYQAIHIRTLATGRERTLSNNPPRIRWLRWFPDSRSLLVDGYKRGDAQGVIYKIDVQTGRRTDIVRSTTEALVRPEASPDGKTLFYERADPSLKSCRLVARDLQTGREKELFRVIPPARLTNRALSPDGQRLALSIVPGPNRPLAPVLKILSVAGGEPRELIQFDKSEKLRAVGVTWTPDSRNVLFWKWFFPADKELELWRISTEGGEPRRLCSRKTFGHMRVHPDGQRVAFYDRSTTRGVWVMENFLPQGPVAKRASQPKFTKVQIPSKPDNGVLSSDGKTLAFVSKGSVWTVPVSGKVDPYIAGEPRRLTPDVEAWNMNGTLAWSGDGKWIAFNTANEALASTDVYLVSSAGGEARRIPIPLRRCGWPEEFRLSLSPDGKTLAYASLISASDGESEKPTVFTIPVNGGETKQLTDAWTQEPAFSPDGDKVAYVKNYQGDNGKRHSHVWVIPATGGVPVQVSNLVSGQTRGPVWSPDGQMIVFNRRPEGENPKETWIVRLSEDGRPKGSPVKVELPLETFHAVAGWTPDNKIGLQLMNPWHETIYSVPSTGGIATQITPEGMAAYPKWSPDGTRIFFRWYKGEIAFVPAGGGEVTTIPVDSEFRIYEAVPGGGNDISPDGKTIVFSGSKHFSEDGKKRWEVDIFTIPIEGGGPRQLTSSGPAQDRFPCWSPDGQSIAFIRPIVNDNKPVFQIHIISKEGKNLRHITTPSDNVAWAPIDWSPDGESITYFSHDNTIKSIPVEGGESRVLASVDAVNSHFELAWSPDGKQLAYTCKGKIWVTSGQGGTPEEVKAGLDADSTATKIGWSPDGSKMAFTVHGGGRHELYLMENFLPRELGK